MADQLKNYETQLKSIYECFYQNYTENLFKSDIVKHKIPQKNATKLNNNNNFIYKRKENVINSNASVINKELNPKDIKNSMSSSSSSSSSITLSSLLFKYTNTTTHDLSSPTTKIITTDTTNTTKRRNKIHNKIMDKKRYHVDSYNILSDDYVAIQDTLTTTTTLTAQPTPMTTTAVKSKSFESEFMKIVKVDINKDERNNKRKFSKSLKDIKTGVVEIVTKTNTLTDKEELFNKKDSIELKCKREEEIIEEENEYPTATKKIKINTTTEKDEMFQIFQPWALRTYGDQAKTKTITLKKKQRILKALDGKEHNKPDSSKFRFWVKSKGFTTKKPDTFIDTEIDNLMMTKDTRNVIKEKNYIELYVASTSKDFGERFYRKVAVVEEFFNIIFDVHVNLGGRSGRHAGQKRTYRIITETYAFLPREAVTKFLSGCPECKKNLRPFSPNRIDEHLTESSSEFETINVSLLKESSSKNFPAKQLEFLKNSKLETPSELLRIDNRKFSEPPSPKNSFISETESRLPKAMSYLDDLGVKLSEFNSRSIELNSENLKVYSDLLNYYQFISKFYNQQQSTTINCIPSPLNVPLTNRFGISPKHILELKNYLNPIKTIRDYQMFQEIPMTSCHASTFIPISSSLNSQENFFETNSLINLSNDSNEFKISSTIHHQETSTRKDIPCDMSINMSDTSAMKSSFFSDIVTSPNLQYCNVYKPEAIEISPEIVAVSSNSSMCCSDSDDDNSRQTCAINLSKKKQEITETRKCDLNTDVIDLKINKKNADDDNKDNRNDNNQINLETVSQINMGIVSKDTVDNKNSNKVDFKPITSTYLKLTRSMGLSDEDALKIDDLETVTAPTPDTLPSEPSPEDAYAGFMKDADKLKLMLLAWNYQNSNAIRNGTGDVPDLGMVGGLWAQYQNALALNAKQPSVSPVLRTEQTSSPIENQDETNSSGQKDEDDGSEDDSDDKLDQNAQDPERLKAFNMFVRLFVDENLDRMIPISKQPKEKIQAIIDSCARQFPEFSERSRKRIRTYLKSCRRNKKAREGWDNSSRPTPAHLTSVQAEQILALACENESLNAKRMRVGLDPISQAVPLPGGIGVGSLSTSSTNSTNIIDNSAPSTTTTASSSSLYTGFRSTPNSISSNNDTDVTMVPVTTTAHTINSARSSPLALNANGMIVDAKNLSTSLTNTVLTNNNNNNLNTNNNILNNLNTNNLNNTGNTQCASPLYRPTDFTSPSSTSSPYQTGSRPPTYPTFFPSSTTGNSTPTDLSMKPSQHQQTNNNNNNNNNNIQLTSQSLTTSAVVSAGLSPSSSRPPIVTHKLSANEITAARQVITAYRESAAFLLRTADQVEQLLIQQQ